MDIKNHGNYCTVMRGTFKLQELYQEPVRRQYGLSKVEIVIVNFLYNNPQRDTASEIVRMRMLQRGNVSQGVEALIQKGFLKRTEDPKDRRRIHLSLTEKATPLVTAVEAQQEKMLAQIFAGFDEEEKNLYQEMNRRIEENILVGLEENPQRDGGCGESGTSSECGTCGRYGKREEYGEEENAER